MAEQTKEEAKKAEKVKRENQQVKESMKNQAILEIRKA